jgi:toxin ParE1/3/4
VKLFKYSSQAKADLLDIGHYTLETWGEAQAGRYLDQIEDCCQLLAENPRIGRAFSSARPGLRRIEQGSHVIFYQETPSGILITRILHRSMLPGQHALDET